MYVPEISVDLMSIVPRERQLVTDNGTLSIKEKREKNIYGSYVEKPNVLKFRLVRTRSGLRT